MTESLQDAARQGDSAAVMRELRTLASRHPDKWTTMLRDIPEALRPFVMAHITVKASATPPGYAVTIGMPAS
jgi:hypothetical protein